jgi:hypothetical protein
VTATRHLSTQRAKEAPSDPFFLLLRQPPERPHELLFIAVCVVPFYSFMPLLLIHKSAICHERKQLHTLARPPQSINKISITNSINLQECSVFVFEKRIADKLHKPKRKETVTELLKASVKQLERFRHPKVSALE